MTSARLVPLSHPRLYKVPTCYSATHTGRISERTDTAHAAATPSSSSSGAGYRRSPRGCPAPHIPTAPSMHISRTSVPMYLVHTINMAICTICTICTLTPCTTPQRRNQRPRSARATRPVCPPPQRDQAGPFPQDRRSLRPVTSRPKCTFRTIYTLDMSDKRRWDERWDVYFHAFLLHETKHSDCYYYNGRTCRSSRLCADHQVEWWFPENRRNEKTLHMFVAARWAPLEYVFCAMD